jgi:hypothetical protein
VAVTRLDPTDSSAQTTTWVIPAEGETPEQVAAVMYAVDAVPDRLLYVAEGHDFYTEQTGAFIPLGLGTFADEAEAVGAIEWSLRGR